MSRVADFLHVDPETGDTCVMFVQDGVGHEVLAHHLELERREGGFEMFGQPSASVPSNDEDIEHFVKSFEHAYPTQRD